jgi:hypothetical protein
MKVFERISIAVIPCLSSPKSIFDQTKLLTTNDFPRKLDDAKTQSSPTLRNFIPDDVHRVLIVRSNTAKTVIAVKLVSCSCHSIGCDYEIIAGTFGH